MYNMCIYRERDIERDVRTHTYICTHVTLISFRLYMSTAIIVIFTITRRAVAPRPPDGPRPGARGACGPCAPWAWEGGGKIIRTI